MHVRRPRSPSVLIRLLVAYLLPTLALLAVFGFFAERVTRHALDASLGRRLTGIAQASTTQVRQAVLDFLAPGDDDSLSAKRLRRKLVRLRDSTRVARIFVLDAKLRSKCDTAPGARIGDRHYNAEADRDELKRVFSGEVASSVLFVGSDKKTYKTGYAPIYGIDDDGRREVIATLGVVASAEYFLALDQLRSYLLLLGGVVVLLIIAVTVLVARRTTHPLRALAKEAERIGAGQLERPITSASADEVGLLARTMNEMREALQARESELQLMLSGIAHEVRNPLGGIALFAGLLREEVAADQDQLEMVQRIERELEYLKRVVNDFLAYARKMPLSLAPVSLAALCDDIAEIARGQAEEAEVKLELEADDIQALGDAEQLRRVALNLLGNAIHASEPGAVVTLRCGEADKGKATPYLEVEDRGCGVDDELREKIFTPFFTTREKGTGLGLALSKKIIDEHGGHFELDSEVGRGTRVRITLQPAPQRSSSPNTV
ncbi:MAG: two-component sensor histidine kinase [Proteobacteria bacterium]|nr:MAG: two-component sensor histidine kinase [Pseudomonadota bacterium]PIE17022.1 MAG: two-component sensor histidine kinase [Pseudomonadota bacterium]